MKISVRTSYFEIFAIFFQTFLINYEEKLGDLVVLIDDNSSSIDRYKKLHKWCEYKFELDIVKREMTPRGTSGVPSHNAHLLMRALDYDEVVTFDDDIIFIDPGIFDLIDRETTPNSIFGQSFITRDENIKRAPASYFLGKRNIKLSENDFYFFADENDRESMRYYEMNDASKLAINYPDKMIFLDKFLDIKQRGHSFNCVQTKYYFHISQITDNYEAILRKASII